MTGFPVMQVSTQFPFNGAECEQVFIPGLLLTSLN